jgi:5-methylcytosine-specific restriction protein B
MPTLRLIEPLPLQRIQSLLKDDNVPVQPIVAHYEDYAVRNDTQATGSPLRFLWERGSTSEPLFFTLSTRGSKASKANPGAHLIIGTKVDDRIIGYLLSQMPQDDEHVYLSFKMGNGEGGNNRWFGRGRYPTDTRSDEAMSQLHEKLRQTWQAAFSAPMPPHPTLLGDWLLLARLPLAELDPATVLNQRSRLKTVILEKLAQAFVIAEKLRDKSFQGTETLETGGAKATFPLSKMATALNQILYGPPGTGKTHHTKARAVGIIENLTDGEITNNYSREEICSRFEDYRQAGQIEFVTFHQAFGYEDFVEGIKPILVEDHEAEQPDKIGYKLVDGLFLRMCRLATYALLLKHREQLPATAEADFDALFNDLYTRLMQGLDKENKDKDKLSLNFKTKSGPEITVTSVAQSSKIYFNHKEGLTDHAPYLIKRENLKKLFDTFASVSDIKNVYNDIVNCIGHCNASGYWALLNYLKVHAHRREEIHSVQQLSLTEQLQRAYHNYEQLQADTQSFDFSKLTKKDFQNAPRFVLIIDEINRGNVANIFGELITLLEDDKRAGRPEALTVKLPYSKEDFTVPENLYLLGTMNTADRSVEALDTALRRRFSFTEMLPEPQVLRKYVGENGVLEGVDVARLLEVLNGRLEQLLDRDHCLGHALLLRISNLEELRAAFQRNILPLLQEYFFGDWGKIGLVLGERFIGVAEAKNLPPLAKFGKYDAGSYGRDKAVYRLTKPETWDAAAFQSIYNPA